MSLGMSAGSYSESASNTSRWVPLALEMPVRTAAPLPRLVSCRTFTCLLCQLAWSNSLVRSVDPSSTTMISKSPGIDWAIRASSTWRIVCSSLYTGTTMVNLKGRAPTWCGKSDVGVTTLSRSPAWAHVLELEASRWMLTTAGDAMPA
jgi:hypothetical protein